MRRSLRSSSAITSARGCASRTRDAQLGQEMLRTVVTERVRGVEAKAVDVVLGQPVERVLDEERAHVLGVLAVEVHAGAPRAAMTFGEVVRESTR